MKTMKARTAVILAFCFSLFMGLAQAEEYYIYKDLNGKLVISNKEPPPGSRIIKQQTLPEGSDTQHQNAQERVGVEPQPNGIREESPNPSNNK